MVTLGKHAPAKPVQVGASRLVIAQHRTKAQLAEPSRPAHTDPNG
jgi:hypothetical protein